jgi:hypothetical protein
MAVQVTLTKSKETKNAIQFTENVAEGRDRGSLGSVYLLKSDFAELGSPNVIQVTVDKKS